MGAPRVPDATLVAGFRDAVARVEASGSGEEGFRAMFEALAWAGAVRDRLRSSGSPIPALTGLWYVRNLVLHAGAEVVWAVTAYGAATYGSATYGGVGFAFGTAGVSRSGTMFPPRSTLRPEESRRNFGGSEYDEHVATRPVMEVLERALSEAMTGAQSGAQGPQTA
jgi:hypothetical protein